MSLRALTICTNGESVSHECSNSAAHKALKNAMFATAAGISVAVDGTNTASHSGHDS